MSACRSEHGGSVVDALSAYYLRRSRNSFGLDAVKSMGKLFAHGEVKDMPSGRVLFRDAVADPGAFLS